MKTGQVHAGKPGTAKVIAMAKSKTRVKVARRLLKNLSRRANQGAAHNTGHVYVRRWHACGYRPMGFVI
jgi:hypothetical protein